MKRFLPIVVLTFFLSCITSPTFAADSSQYTIPSDVQGAGGGDEAKSNNYRLIDTLGEPNIGPSNSGNYSLEAGYRQVASDSLSMGCSTSIGLGTINGSGQATGSGSCVITTDAAAGYQLLWRAMTADMQSGADSIAAYTPATANAPETWNIAATDSEWGGRLQSASTDTAAEWGTDTLTDKWLNVATANRNIVTRSSRTSLAGSTEVLQFRSEVGAAKVQPTGAYSVTIVLTAITL